jgi:hypothetical protein
MASHPSGVECRVIALLRRERVNGIFGLIYSLGVARYSDNNSLVILPALARVIFQSGKLSHASRQVRTAPNTAGVNRASQENTGVRSCVKLQRGLTCDLARNEFDLCPEGKHLRLVEVLPKSLAVWRSTDYNGCIASEAITRQRQRGIPA